MTFMEDIWNENKKIYIPISDEDWNLSFHSE